MNLLSRILGSVCLSVCLSVFKLPCFHVANERTNERTNERINECVGHTSSVLYTTQLCEDADFDRAAGLRASLDPLLDRFRVNLVLVGHQHSYERTCAIINGTCASSGWGASSGSGSGSGGGGGGSAEEEAEEGAGAGGVAGDGAGTVHAVVGSAGAELEKCGFSRLNGLFDVAHANMWGYARMTADHESFTFQFVANNDGSIFDEVQLTPWH